MTHGDAAANLATRPKRARRGPGSLYAFVVTLICVFVAGVMLAPATPKQYVVQATVSLADSAERTEAELLAQLRESIVADDNLRRILVEVGPPTSAAAETASNWPPYSEIERLKANVALKAVDGGEGVKLLVVETNKERGLEIARLLTEHTRDDHAVKGSSNFAVNATVQQRVQELRDVEQAAREKLDAFLQKQFQTVEDKAPSKDTKPDGVSSKKNPRGISPAGRGGVARWNHSGASQREALFILAAFGDSSTRTVNPAWRELQQELDEKSVERDRLLRTLTPLHPQVQQIEVEMSEIRRRQYNTPQYLDGSAAPASNAPNSHPNPNPNPESTPTPSVTLPGQGGGSNDPGVNTPRVPITPRVPTTPPNAGASNPSATPPAAAFQLDPATRTKVVAQYQTLRGEYDQARRELDEAESALARINLQTTPQTPPPSEMNLLAPPSILAAQGGAPSTLGLALVGVIALAMATAVGISLRGATPTTNVLTTPDQASEAMGLPIIGDLRTRRSPVRQAPVGRRVQLARHVVRASELLLAVFALAFLLAAMLDSPFMSEAMQNPLAAVSQIMHRLTNLI
ncbi:MAG: hypothetical protein RIC55_01425 [Pirellulaceae bacterium]